MAQSKKEYFCIMYVRKKKNRSCTIRVVVVSKSSRISKGTLEMRPMFHFIERRIEAHVCICFVAYKLFKELERIVRQKIELSVNKVLEAAKTITTIRINLPQNGGVYTKTLFLTEKQRAIQSLFDIAGREK